MSLCAYRNRAGLTIAGLTIAGVTSAGLTIAGLTSAGLTSAGLTIAGLRNVCLTQCLSSDTSDWVILRAEIIPVCGALCWRWVRPAVVMSGMDLFTASQHCSGQSRGNWNRDD